MTVELRKDSIAALDRFRKLSLFPWGTAGFLALPFLAWKVLDRGNVVGARLRSALATALESTPGDAGRLDPEVVRRGILYAVLGLAALVVLVFLVRWTGWRRRKAPERMGEYKRAWFRGGRLRLPWIRIVLTLLAFGALYGLDHRHDLVSPENFAAVRSGLHAFALGLAIWTGAALVGWVTRRLSVPSGRKMDEWLQDLIGATRNQSLEKLGLVEDELTKEPIVLLGLVEDMNLIPPEDRWIRKGRTRSSATPRSRSPCSSSRSATWAYTGAS